MNDPTLDLYKLTKLKSTNSDIVKALTQLISDKNLIGLCVVCLDKDRELYCDFTSTSQLELLGMLEHVKLKITDKYKLLSRDIRTYIK